jgi:hypothetical protein
MPLLTAKSFNFANGHPFNPNRNQRRFYIVHFERFNDCLDLLHQFYGETIRKTTQGKATLRMPPISRAEIDSLSWQHLKNKCAAGCGSVLPSYITQPLLLTAGLDFEVRSQKHRELMR